MRPSSVVRPVLPRKAIVGVIATFAIIAVPLCGVALADSVATNFETFTTGTVNGQDGWKSDVPGDIPSLPHGYDQEVVDNALNAAAPPEFGTKSLRISNAYGTAPDTSPPEFELQTYSKPTLDPAGEDLTNTVYSAQFSFISFHPNQQQHRLYISVSPDNGHGGRMSYIGLDDEADGIHVIFYDTPDPNADANDMFVEYDLKTLARNQPHTIRFFMSLNPGPDNDLVRIFIDGQDYGQCFTTWENYYRNIEHNPVPISDRLLFLSGNRDGDRLDLLGGGYLFDNVTTSTFTGTGPLGCDDTIDKQFDSPTVTAGGLAGYKITVRNRGHATSRNLRVCDHIPRHTTFVRASRKLVRLGRRRCYVIPILKPGRRSSVHITLRVDSNAPPGNLDNIADLTPAEPPALPPLNITPPKVDVPLPPKVKDVIRQLPPISKVKAIVKILKHAAATTQPSPPPVTG